MLPVEVLVTYEQGVEVYSRNILQKPKDEQVISTLVSKERELVSGYHW